MVVSGTFLNKSEIIPILTSYAADNIPVQCKILCQSQEINDQFFISHLYLISTAIPEVKFKLIRAIKK